ncbi:adenosylhomocysteinase [Kribbella sp. NPDC050124]|uniref:adenosylhomocysteinase n=1 Tax=Kribbella sp. NPDC050124 TaxID=3364114 RepID=UPI003787FCD4
MTADVARGREAIAWVREFSPVLDGHVRSVLSDGAIDGRKVAVVVHLEAKTAFLALVLAEAGADVVVAGSNPHTTNGDVVAALRADGLQVLAHEDAGIAQWEQDLIRVADTHPELIIDDGAELTIRMAKHRPHAFTALRGVSEETTTGTARLEAMHSAGSLPFPTLTANNARCKHLFDNRYGTGQTTIQSILRLTNRQFAGATVAIIGYGWVGTGIAAYAKALGARVAVVEVDEVRALEAYMDGHEVGRTADVLPKADFVITATGGVRAIGAPEFASLKPGAILANAGHHDLEIDVPALGTGREVRPQLTSHNLGDKQISLLSHGALVNIAGGSGHPVEIMDLSFAVQGLGCHYLASHDLPAGVHVLPKELDDSIAAARLAAAGIRLDQLQPYQLDDVSEWIG